MVSGGANMELDAIIKMVWAVFEVGAITTIGYMIYRQFRRIADSLAYLAEALG
jgi:hypothetical protein